MRKRARRSNNPHHWASYGLHRNHLRALTNEKYNLYIANSLNYAASNPKRFWGIVRSKIKCKSLPVEIKDGEYTVSSDVDKANLFNKYLFSNFSEPAIDETLPVIQPSLNPALSNIMVTVDEVRLIVTTLDINKASGPDYLTGRLCCWTIAPSLTVLFNSALSSGVVPDFWKLANIIPVFKKGDKCQCSNYRPVSLLCIVSKVLERIILNNIYNSLLPFITSAQHRFLRGRSVSTQVLFVFYKVNTYYGLPHASFRPW